MTSIKQLTDAQLAAKADVLAHEILFSGEGEHNYDDLCHNYDVVVAELTARGQW